MVCDVWGIFRWRWPMSLSSSGFGQSLNSVTAWRLHLSNLFCFDRCFSSSVVCLQNFLWMTVLCAELCRLSVVFHLKVSSTSATPNPHNHPPPSAPPPPLRCHPHRTHIRTHWQVHTVIPPPPLFSFTFPAIDIFLVTVIVTCCKWRTQHGYANGEGKERGFARALQTNVTWKVGHFP